MIVSTKKVENSIPLDWSMSLVLIHRWKPTPLNQNTVQYFQKNLDFYGLLNLSTTNGFRVLNIDTDTQKI